MAKAKNPHTTVDNGILAKSHHYVDLIDNEALIFFPGRNEWRKRFIRTLIDWSRREESYEFQQFYDEYNIPYRTVNGWRREHPEVDEAMNLAALTLASKRRVGALTKKLDKDVVFRDIHKYDPEWIAINKYHADLKKEETHVPTTFVLQSNGNGGLKKPEVITQEEMERDNDQSV